MNSFDASIEQACKDGLIPGAVLVASSADGKIRYEKAFGLKSLESHTPMETDTAMWMASCTKLLTTIAALQCVEKGYFTLDEDISRILPEMKDREIFKGFDEETGKPILVKRVKDITLRHLLTHQSGIAYDIFSPALLKYQKKKGVTPGMSGKRSIAESYDYPLLFEPGESWEYGVGVDWAGEMVMRVTNSSLEEYLRKHVFAALGVENITFFPQKYPGFKAKLADMSQRQGGLNMFKMAADPLGKLKHTKDTAWTLDSTFCHGGGGGYGDMVNYHKVLHSICADDGRILNSETVREMFKPQLTDAAREQLSMLNAIPEVCQGFGGVEGKLDYGLGGMLNLEASHGRNVGSIAWGGYPNLIWWIDRTAGISGIIGSQIIPPGDIQIIKLQHAWSEALYKEAGVKEKERL